MNQFNNQNQHETPRELEAKIYLERNRILELLDNMTAMLIYGRPDEPRSFLIQQLEKLKLARQSGVCYPCLFDDSNLTAIFGMLDPTKRGYITREQFVEALKTMGVTNFDEFPQGSDVNKVTLDTFVREAKLGLSVTSATFRQ